MNTAYITVEETTGNDYMNEITTLVVSEFDNTEIKIIESHDYFVLKFNYEDYSEIQEIISTISFLITGYRIERFTITINSDELYD